jgi:transcriptional regulator with XRE-family HTH domain
MLAFDLVTPGEVAGAVAERARARRVALGLTQVEAAERTGIGLSSLRRFESTGRIGFDALVRLAFVLDAVAPLGALFPETAFRSLDEVVERPRRRRVRKPRRQG